MAALGERKIAEQSTLPLDQCEIEDGCLRSAAQVLRVFARKKWWRELQDISDDHLNRGKAALIQVIADVGKVAWQKGCRDPTSAARLGVAPNPALTATQRGVMERLVKQGGVHGLVCSYPCICAHGRCVADSVVFMLHACSIWFCAAPGSLMPTNI